MNIETLQQLKRLAEEATPGPWVVGDHPSKVVAPCPCCGLIATCSQYGPGEGTDSYNSEYIAGTNPAVLLELLAEIEQLQGDIEYARERLTSHDDPDRDTITIRDLIDEATNRGDFFPSDELKRRKKQIAEINRHFQKCQEFSEELIATVKRLQAVMDAATAFLVTPPGAMTDDMSFNLYMTVGSCRLLSKAYREAVEAKEKSCETG